MITDYKIKEIYNPQVFRKHTTSDSYAMLQPLTAAHP